LNIWVGDAHDTPQGKYLVINLATEIEFQNFIMENGAAKANERPERTSDGVLARYTQEAILVGISNPNIQISLICLISVNIAHKPTPRYKRKMPHRIDIFKRIIPHINIQIQAINCPC
jgi:hypothetical protein